MEYDHDERRESLRVRIMPVHASLVAARSMKTVRCLFAFALLAIFAQAAVSPARAQDEASDRSSRFGLSLNVLYSSDQGMGTGFRGRASIPINADISTALELGFTGFAFEGWQGADYLFDPQISLIITPPPSRLRAWYLFLGMGAYLPLAGDKDLSGPTMHLGIGRAHGFGESALFYEIDPTLVIGRDQLGFLLPLRIGLIF